MRYLIRTHRTRWPSIHNPSKSPAPPPLRTEETLDEWLMPFTEQSPDDPNDSTSSVALSTGQSPIRNRAQFAWTQQRFILENIKLADTKAGFVITLASASLSAFFTRGPGIPTTSLNTTIIALLTATGVCALLAAIAFGAWSIKPRIGSSGTASPISWTEIARYPTLAAYQTESRTISEEATTEALVEQVFYLSRICLRKHVLIARAIVLAMTGGLALILDLIVFHFAQH